MHFYQFVKGISAAHPRLPTVVNVASLIDTPIGHTARLPKEIPSQNPPAKSLHLIPPE